ncbi:MAG: hypothetical protein BMS9Abin05_0121 [Rhodothermia bacterium]|nr:MAG: hypothetical protein BMS9Abin05_0121 [Rhodothermia bacterium]
MESWTIPASIGDLFLDFALLSILLIGGSIARRYVPVFRRFLIPNSLLAGFIGLLIGPEVFSIVTFSLERMGAYVYHLLALTFIGVGLQSSSRKIKYSVVNLGFMQVSVMLIQGLIGLSVALLAMLLFLPELVPAIGLLLPLGFAMGPGIAFSIGNAWSAFGFEDAASVGLGIAAIGFLFAYVSGVMIINRTLMARESSDTEGHSDGLSSSMMKGIRDAEDRPVGATLTFFSGAIEPLTVHLALIGLVYALTYAFTAGLEQILVAGGLDQEVPIVWSFHFIFANLIALGIRHLIDFAGAGHLLDAGMMRRLTGSLADFLITASIAAISLRIAWTYAGPVLVMSILGAWITYLFLKWSSQKVFTKYRFERFIGIYAQMTGTISSGLALIRVTDPEYRSPVAEDLVLSSGMALAFGFPLLILINMPFTVFSGSITGYIIIISIMIVYLLIIGILWYGFVQRSSHEELT